MTVTQPSTSFDGLHALKVKGFCTDDAFVAITGATPEEAAQTLQGFVDEGLAKRREGRMAGTLLTPQGVERHAELLDAERSQEGFADAVGDLYQAFLPINSEFKRVCMRWQTLEDGEPNPHDNADYDATVIEAAAALVSDYTNAVSQVPASPRRFTAYAERLKDALEKVKSGDRQAFMRPMHESIHDIWMELHQDLLLSVGQERGEHDEA